ncbi:protein-L-isoaspartate O-methyltransferase [Paracoccus suum]|uniref:Protein-L-isoaspartate O-methyltransferase n=1 Tax=Paracoccus suum TaxID=2259340 RepID=A0A344PJ57_9RHOB|nr:protein-L-isoaspartate O-methyltransferase [Paracoccus suum]AXC49412.1 protein-L-isoaspartate O-methyltransferase [Paracoccus suum]
MLDFAQARTTMVDTQVRPSDVTRFPVIEAMLAIPRELFVPAPRRSVAYVGENLSLPGGRVMLEARTLAKMIDGLDPGPEDLVLDVACSNGYAAAVLGRIAGAVVALEDEAGAVATAEGALREAGAETVAVVQGPLTEGWDAQAPYDIMIVSGGAVEVVPDSLTSQLREGGRIAALFHQGALGVVRIGLKSGGEITWRDQFNAHAPLLAGFARQRGFTL